jgi:hypothetical protein
MVCKSLFTRYSGWFVQRIFEQLLNNQNPTNLKQIITFSCLFFISIFSFGQIQIDPETSSVDPLPNRQAKIKSSDNKPYWIGTGGYPHFHLDSSGNHKVGIGVGFKSTNTPFSPLSFTEHAKVHIRHEGGTGNLKQGSKGPQLLLDESTADHSAVLRFRQSTIATDGEGFNEIIPGARYWDIRGFANSTSPVIPWGDELLFINSALINPVLSIAGTGAIGVNKQVPERTLHVNGNSLIQSEDFPNTTFEIKSNENSLLQFGEVGLTTGFGEIKYETESDAMTISTNGGEFGVKIKDNKLAVGGSTSFNPTSALDVHGYTQLGESAPKIKMETLNIVFPGSNNAALNYTLPVDASKIIHLEIIVEDNDVSPSKYYSASSFFPGARFQFVMQGTTLTITTLGTDAVLSSLIGFDPAKVMITHME